MGLLLRNWHIKLAATAIATVLYTGIVFSGSFREESLPAIEVQALHQPANTHLVDGGLTSVDVRFRAPVNLLPRVSRASFQAFVDLSTYDLDRAGEPQRLAVEVTGDDGIQVLDWTPRQLTVTLDHLGTRRIPVVVDPGELPDGFEVGTPRVDPVSVEARGPRSQLAEVLHAVARVRVDPSGIDVRRQVTLVAVDADGDPVNSIDLTPDLATVDIAVRATETNKTVPVVWQTQGNPAPGFVVDVVSAEPAVVTVRGDPRVLAALESVETAPVSIEGVSATATFPAQLLLPDGVTLVDDQDPVIEVQVSVAEGSRTVTVGIVCSGAPDGGRCEPQVDRISVTIAGPVPALNDITAAELTPSVSVAGLQPGRHRVEPTLSLPEGITLVAISPTDIEVLVVAPAASGTPVPTAAP